MKIELLIRKFEEGQVIEKAMADAYRGCLNIALDNEMKEKLKNIIADEEEHARMTNRIIEILSKNLAKI